MQSAFSSFASRPRWQQWGILLTLSAAFIGILELVRIPAAWLLGPMFAGIIIGAFQGRIQIPSLAFKGSKAIIGCMIAASLSPQVIAHFMHDWWLFVGIILLTIVASSIMGYIMAKMHVMPGTTAVWGTTPGAAATMVIMAETFGADARLVAFMQYMRVLLVTVAASVIALFAVPSAADEAIRTTVGFAWFPPIGLVAFGSTLLVAGIGSAVAGRFHMPAGYMLIPLLLGGLLQGMGLIEMQLPRWLLAPSFALLGWRIDLTFDPYSLRHAYKALPAVLTSVVLLMAFCGVLAWVLVQVLGVDPLTAYLATSPGGLDTVAVIAASRPYVDISFVVTLQTARLFLLSVICPSLARYLAKRSHEQDTMVDSSSA